MRRSYLRQLLFDLTAALEELGQEHWVDFGWCASGAAHPAAQACLRVSRAPPYRRVLHRAACIYDPPPAPLPAPPHSLLGIHRDGDLIAHDNDIDLAVSVVFN